MYAASTLPNSGLTNYVLPVQVNLHGVVLEQAPAIGDFTVGFHQNHSTMVIWEAENQNFRHELPNLHLWKIDHRHHLFAYQPLQSIMHGNLRGSFALTNLRSEINIQLKRWFPCLRVRFNPNNGAYTNINFQEFIETNFRSYFINPRRFPRKYS